MAIANLRTQAHHIADTTIGTNSILVGVLSSDSNINIEGVFEGEISAAQHVQISNTGRVRAVINTVTCTVNGSVVGNIHASNSVTIQPSARVWGEIDAATLQIAPGAVFKGVANGSDNDDDIFKK